MANSNFIVHNGLTVGPLSIDATTGSISTTGTIGTAGGYLNGALGANTPNTVVATSITTTSGGQITGYHTGAIGANTANTGVFTSVTTTSGGQITGYHTGAIGANTANTGVFTSVTTVSGGQVTGYMTGPIGANTANTGAFTTLTASGNVSITGNSWLIANNINTTAGTNANLFIDPDGVGDVVFSAATEVFMLSTLDSTTTSTGALVLSGGIGVQKNMTISGNITPASNVTYNLGTTTANWNNVYAVLFAGTSTTAKYADLAECYAGDADYEPGTVVDFGGNQEVTISNIEASISVAGIVSTNPAHLMNSAIEAEYPVAVALTGRVPCKVTGPIRKGQMMVSAGNGRARAASNTSPAIGSVIGKALENHPDGEGTIEVVVGRL